MHAHRFLTLLAATIAATTVITNTRVANACGGCFHEPPKPSDVSSDSTVVNEHHMVMSISKTQTVLWDQIKYSGNPKEFAWVLPVKPGTTIELSHDEFIKALDAYTAPQVLAPFPPPYQQGKQSAFSCGATTEDSTLASGAVPRDPPVSVVSDVVVGPYEAVTLHANNGSSLNAWLTAHLYEVQAGFQPTIDAYVKEGFDFIALRLLPGKGIQSMQPVRVVTSGADATLPLRMVAAGVGAKVSIVLYVIGEGRYHTVNFPDVTVDDAKLTWDDGTSSSNYATLTQAAMATSNGTGVLTEYAGHVLSSDFNGQWSSLSQAYAQAIKFTQGQGTCTSKPSLFDAGTDSGSDSGSTPLDGSVDASVDASADDASTDGGTSDPCIFDDIAVATSGMNQVDVWVTRLRMDLPSSVLSQGDLRLGAATQTKVSNVHRVPTPPSPSTDSGGCSTQRESDPGAWTAFALGALGLVLAFRRRRRS